MTTTRPDLAALLDRAVSAALAAGEAIMEVYERPHEVAAKSDGSPLTEADLAAHEIICGVLGGALTICSEEGAAVSYEERRGWPRFWLVDPLDGTKEFVKRNGEFTVNIALIEAGAPALGVVYAPVLDVLYTGVVGQGALRWEAGASGNSGNASLRDCLRSSDSVASSSGNLADSHRLSYCRRDHTDNRVVQTPLPDPSLNRDGLAVVVSRSHLNAATEAFIRDLEQTRGPAGRVAMGSSLKICCVADGRADVYPRLAPTMEWDTAAAHAVLNASGGKLVNHNTGDTLRYNEPDQHNPPFVAWATGRGA